MTCITFQSDKQLLADLKDIAEAVFISKSGKRYYAMFSSSNLCESFERRHSELAIEHCTQEEMEMAVKMSGNRYRSLNLSSPYESLFRYTKAEPRIFWSMRPT